MSESSLKMLKSVEAHWCCCQNIFIIFVCHAKYVQRFKWLIFCMNNFIKIIIEEIFEINNGCLNKNWQYFSDIVIWPLEDCFEIY